MRIESINQVASLYQANGKTIKQGSLNIAGSRDALSISQSGYDYQIAKQAVAKTQDIREDKTQQLQDKLSAGTYDVSSENFATKILERYNSL